MNIWGDNLINFSGRGPTSECIVKPDIIAPGCDIISCLSNSAELSANRKKELKTVSDHYVKMSGTSMSAPVITGAAALLLQKNPGLSPNEVKYMLKNCATPLNYAPNQQGWGLIDIQKFLFQEVEYVRQ